jgi:hypothetical protein
VFVYATSNVYAVSDRIGIVRLRPESPWRELWQWTLR